MTSKQKTLFETWNKSSQKAENSNARSLQNNQNEVFSPVASNNSNIFQSPVFNRNVSNQEEFDFDAGQTWIYPTNYPVRDYQFSIVKEALFQNTLVILPTGLGKTFIAAVVMFNIYRWYPNSKIIFMAPTRPLVTQQIEACFKITGIPQEDTTQMTGTNVSEQRKLMWQRKRVFFLTPQVLANDLVRNICPAASIKCVVVDEAHKALGNHSYCQVIRELSSYTTNFRVLALTATPGSETQSVKQVLSNLLISHVEMRTEDSEDVKQYTHIRDIEKVVVPLGNSLSNLKSKFLDIIHGYLKRLQIRNAIGPKNPSSLSKFQMLKLREIFSQQPPPTISRHEYGLIMADFSLCISLYHAYELLLLHGTRSFYNFLMGIINGEKSIPHARSELSKNFCFEEMLEEIKVKYIGGLETVPHNDVRVRKLLPSHPKLVKLEEIVLEHFRIIGTDSVKNTRVMIFSQYRDSVQEITELLSRHEPKIKVMSFLGQAAKSASSTVFTQKLQLQVIEKFRSGGYNTLVATCVGEEGLDIGEVDLIVCYDCPKSPIRLVQRMGRTGRFRKGRIIILLAEGKEEQTYKTCEYQKKSINQAIKKGFSFAQLYQDSPSLVPRGVKPICVKKHIEIEVKKLPSKKKQNKPTAFLSEEEKKEFDACFKVPHQNQPLLASSEMVCLKSHEKVAESDLNHCQQNNSQLSLANWTLWQTTPQRTHFVSHSLQTSILVEVMEHICYLQTCPERISKFDVLPKTLDLVKKCDLITSKNSNTKDVTLYNCENIFEDDSDVICLGYEESSFFDHKATKNAALSFTSEKFNSNDNLLKRLFGISYIKPLNKVYPLNLNPPPSKPGLVKFNTSSVTETKVSKSFEPKSTTMLRILNKKMAAKLKRKAKELGSCIWFRTSNDSILNKHTTLCNPTKDFDFPCMLTSKSIANEHSDLNGSQDLCEISHLNAIKGVSNDQNSFMSSVNFPSSNCVESCIEKPVALSNSINLEDCEPISFDLGFDFPEEISESTKNTDFSKIKTESSLSYITERKKVLQTDNNFKGKNSNVMEDDVTSILKQFSTPKHDSSPNLDISFTQTLKVKKVVLENDIHVTNYFKTENNQDNCGIDINKYKSSEKQNNFVNSKMLTLGSSLNNDHTKSDLNTTVGSTQCTLTQLLDMINSTCHVKKNDQTLEDKTVLGNPKLNISSSSEDEIAPTPPKNSQKLQRIIKRVPSFDYKPSVIQRSISLSECFSKDVKHQNHKNELNCDSLSEFSSALQHNNNKICSSSFQNKLLSIEEIENEATQKLEFDISFDFFSSPPTEHDDLELDLCNSTKPKKMLQNTHNLKLESLNKQSFINFESNDDESSSGSADQQEFKTVKNQSLDAFFTKNDFCENLNTELLSNSDALIPNKYNFDNSSLQNISQSLIKGHPFENHTSNKNLDFYKSVTKKKIDNDSMFKVPEPRDFPVFTKVRKESTFNVVKSGENFDQDIVPSTIRKRTTDNDSDDDFQFVKKIKGGDSKSIDDNADKKATSKRSCKSKKKRKNKFLLTQADVSGSDSSDEGCNADEDNLDDSFIDDNTDFPQNDTDQYALYLRSTKDVAGLAHNYKLKFSNSRYDNATSKAVNDDSKYEFDSFCVEDNDVEYLSSDCDEKTSKSETNRTKKFKRIIPIDSSSSNDEASPKKRFKHLTEEKQGFNNDKVACKVPSSTSRKSEHDLKLKKGSLNSVSKNTETCHLGEIPSVKSIRNINLDKTQSVEFNHVLAQNSTSSSAFPTVNAKNDFQVSASDSKNLEEKDDIEIIYESSCNKILRNDIFSHSFSFQNEKNTRKNAKPDDNFGELTEFGEEVMCFDLENLDNDMSEYCAHFSAEKNKFKEKEVSKEKVVHISTEKESICKNKLHEGVKDSNEEPLNSVHENLHEISFDILWDEPVSICFETQETTDKAVASTSAAVDENKPKTIPILVDSRELASGKPVISSLRNKYRINPVVMQLSSADYVLSSRLAVERILDSDFSNLTMPPRVIEKIKIMQEMYEQTAIIIERDTRKQRLSFSKNDTKYLTFMLNVCWHGNMNILCSVSPEHTAQLLFGLIQKELKCNFHINVPTAINFRNQELYNFYSSFPLVSPICALNFMYNFPILRMFFESSAEEIKSGGVISSKRASKIFSYLRCEFFHIDY